MPIISKANRKPRPSRRKLRFSPSDGNQLSLTLTSSPANTDDCCANNRIKASIGASPAATEQAERPNLSASSGRIIPKNGKATISASAIHRTPFLHVRRPGHDRRLASELLRQPHDADSPSWGWRALLY